MSGVTVKWSVKNPNVDVNTYKFALGIQEDCKKKDWDIVIIISGAEGSSKSSLSYHLSRIFEGRKAYMWKKHFILSPNYKEVIDRVKKIKKKSVVIDEAIKVLYKFKMWDDLQLLINQLYTVNRQNNNFTMLNIPRQDDLTKFFRDGRAYYWIQVIARGVAVVFVKDENQFSRDVWCFKENTKLMAKLSKGKLFTFLSVEHKLWILSKLPNYVTTLRYKDLPEPDRQDYKNEKRLEEFKGLDLKSRISNSKFMEQRDDLILDMLVNAVHNATGRKYTQTMIANILRVNQSRVSQIVKRRKELEEMGVRG